MIDTSKIIHAPVGGGRYTVTAPIVKEDYGLYLLIEGLELPQTYEVDFSNSEHNGTSVTMIGNADGVLIPHQFIDTGKDIFAFLYHVGSDYGRTVFKFRIPNKLRPDRTDETPTPEEQSTIDQCISALNTAVAQTAQDVIDADASAQSASESAEQAQESARTAGLYSDTAQTYANSAEISANSASASATASAQSASQSAQIKADVEDLADDAQGYASASAQSASASANSASQASASATSASQSATSAQGYASQAQTSAQTASAKASEASGYASTASAKATESAQSASQALTYKTDAESAKTSAQTAQGLAESARDLAQGYAEDAQGYAEDAQASAESISASASQIAQNTADILKAFPTDTASGAVASFTDGADNIPLKSLIVNIDPVQDLSNGDPSPTNICPISGWTGMSISRTRTNVWNEGWELGAFNADTGAKKSNSNNIRSNDYISCAPNTKYYCHNGGVGNLYVFCYDADKIYVGMARKADSGTQVSNSVFTTRDRARYIRFYVTNHTSYSNDISINYPSTDHDYHPNVGQVIPISWQTEAGTVYGGQLNVLSGKLMAEWLSADGGDLTWSKINDYNYGNFYTLPTPLASYVATRPTVISSSYKSESNQSAPSTGDSYVWIRSISANNRRIYVKDTSKASMTAEEFQTAMTGVQFVYELATPIEIQLTPHEVNSLLGANNIFADTGDTSVEYRADITLYISRLTEPDADMIADSNIVSGQYFMVGNNLYKATANIANGGQIVVGTNCTRVSLAQALNEINA